MKLKVMTFNIQHGRNHNLSGDVIDLNAVSDNIIAQNPDIVGLNEIRSGNNPDHLSGLSDQPSYLAKRIGGEYRFGKAIDIYTSCSYGNAIISKYPINDFEVIMIPDTPERTEGYYYETRSIIRTEYELEGKRLTVLNSHFGLAPQEQINAVDTVLSIVETIDNPIVLMGDFNMIPDNYNIKRLSEYFIDTHAQLSEDLPTYPSHFPDERIDYIFVKGLSVLSVGTVRKVVSDHFAITAELEL